MVYSSSTILCHLFLFVSLSPPPIDLSRHHFSPLSLPVCETHTLRFECVFADGALLITIINMVMLIVAS